ncbi:MAG: TenA family protein [Alphaproteobacteria bacterium]
MTDYGSPLYAALKAACPDDWQRYVTHPFVEGMRDGTLPRDAFHAYLKQDYLFLIHFTRAWSMAVVKSDRIDEMRAAASVALSLIDDEMRLHVGICADIGVSEADLGALTEEPECLAYTRFVIDAGLSGDLLDLLTALMPCSFGYGEIGLSLATALQPGGNHPYRDWIEAYAGPDYQDPCRDTARLFESVAARLIGPDFKASPRWPDLCRTFATATRLEGDFWSMGLRMTKA